MTKAYLKQYQALKQEVEDIQTERETLPFPGNNRSYGEGRGGGGVYDLSGKAEYLIRLERKEERYRKRMVEIEQRVNALPSKRQRQLMRAIYIDCPRPITIKEGAERCGISISYARHLHSEALKML